MTLNSPPGHRPCTELHEDGSADYGPECKRTHTKADFVSCNRLVFAGPRYESVSMSQPVTDATNVLPGNVKRRARAHISTGEEVHGVNRSRWNEAENL